MTPERGDVTPPGAVARGTSGTSDERGLVAALCAGLRIVLAITDDDGVCHQAYGAGVEGLSRDDVAGRSLLELFAATEVADILRAALGGSVVALKPVDRDGVPWNVQAAPLADGAVLIVSRGGDWARADQAERELGEHRRALLVQLFEVEEAARQRVAAQVHDDTMQLLTAVAMRLQLLRPRLVRDDVPAATLEELAGIDVAVGAAVARLRSVLFDLEPSALASHGIEAALRDLAAERFVGTGCDWRVDVQIGEEPGELVGRGIYRVAQEAVSNVVRHARAAHVTLELRSLDDGTRLRVMDDGVGIGHLRAQPGHLGLASMQQRVGSLGGTVTVVGQPSGGTLVQAWLPRTHGLDRLDMPSLRQTLTEVLATLDVGVILLDRHDRCLYVNDSAGLMLGEEPTSLIGSVLGGDLDRDTPFLVAFRAAVRDQRVVAVTDYYPRYAKAFTSRIHPSSYGTTVLFHEVPGEQRAREEHARRRQLAALVSAVGTALVSATDPQRRLLDACVALTEGCLLEEVQVLDVDGRCLAGASAAPSTRPTSDDQPTAVEEVALQVGGRRVGALRLVGGRVERLLARPAAAGFALALAPPPPVGGAT